MRKLDIYITELCNLNCDYCYVSLNKKESTTFKFENFISKVNLQDYDFVSFLGGEPLIRFEEIRKIIEYVNYKNMNLKFSVVTNGLLVTKAKLDFFRKNNVSLAISLHKKSLKRTLDKEFLNLLLLYKNIIGFIIIFEEGKECLGVQIFLLLVKFGFRVFSFIPLTTCFWTSRNSLFKELSYIKAIAQINKGLIIEDIQGNYLRNRSKENFCSKKQVNRSGSFYLCTRFDKTNNILQDKDRAYYLFNKLNPCKSCSVRWFCICPVGLYLDNKDNLTGEELNKKIKNFCSLNKLFINFYRDIAEILGKRNYLTRNIDEIRFNLTEQCNLRCNYCYLDFQNKVLDESVAKNIIDFYIEQNGENKIISFFGGEPLLEFELLSKLVLYAKTKAIKIGKTICFKLATNGLLFNKQNLNFLKENKFEIHLSMNGSEKYHNFSRDNSFLALFKKIKLLKLFFSLDDIVILYVLHPIYVKFIKVHIAFIKSLGFNKILIEIILSENKNYWKESDFSIIRAQFFLMKKCNIFEEMNFLNIYSKNNKVVLDISTSGIISEHSFAFYNKDVDFSAKRKLNNIFYNLMSKTSDAKNI